MISFLFILSLFSYEVILTLDKEKHKFEGPIYYYVFNSLLFSLLVLHIYWWILMFRMLVKQIQSRGRVGDDVRSGKYLVLRSKDIMLTYMLSGKETLYY